MYFKIIYILFFIASLIYGSLQIVGPITPRHVMTIIMLCMCFKEGMPRFDKYMVVFNIFVICYIFSGVIYQNDFADTIKWAIAQHFVAIVAYQSTRILTEKYNAEHILLYTFLAIGLLDALVTIGQYHVGPYAELIMQIISNNMEDADMTDIRGLETMAGYVPPGIVGSVANGYLLSSTCILSLYNKKAKIKLINILLLCFSVYALFCVQERTAFVVGIALSLFYLYKLIISRFGGNLFIKSLVNISFSAFIMIGIMLFFIIIAENEDTRYNDGFEMSEERTDLITSAVKFISENPFGGIYEYNRQNHDLPPHNLFLNCFVWGGYLGGIMLLLLLYWKMVIIYKGLLKAITIDNIIIYTSMLVYLGLTLNSLTHNAAIVSGDFSFWTFWAICAYSIIKSKNYSDNKCKDNI